MTNLPSTNVLSDYNVDDDFKDMRPQDRIIPRLQLMQGLSKTVRDRLATNGDWFDMTAKKVAIPYGKQLNLIPLVYWLEWIEWNPAKDGPKIIARSTDPIGQLARTCDARVEVKNSEGKMVQKVTEQYCFLCLAPEYTGTWFDCVQVSFGRTSHKVGKSWLNRLSIYRMDVTNENGTVERIKAPIFSAQWPLGAAPETNAKSQEYNIATIGNATPVDVTRLPELKALATQFKAMKAMIQAKSLAAGEAEDAGETVVEVTDISNSEM